MSPTLEGWPQLLSIRNSTRRPITDEPASSGIWMGKVSELYNFDKFLIDKFIVLDSFI